MSRSPDAADAPRRALDRASLAFVLGSLFLFSSGGVAEAQYYKTTVASATSTSTSFTPVAGSLLQFTPTATTEVWVLLFSARLFGEPITWPKVIGLLLVIAGLFVGVRG